MDTIVMEQVSKIFENGAVGVKEVNLTIEKGEFVFILGKSGAGKSTLLKLMTKELEPTNGTVFIYGVAGSAIPKKEMPFLRRSFGIVHHSPALLENKNVFDNIAFAMMVTEQPKEAMQTCVTSALGIVGLKKKMDALPEELSGGEKFRVGLARALVNNPKIIIADEPTANLDSGMSWDMMNLLDEINRMGVTIIMATHAKDLVNLMRKRVVTLYGGKIMGDVKKGRYGDIV